MRSSPGGCCYRPMPRPMSARRRRARDSERRVTWLVARHVARSDLAGEQRAAGRIAERGVRALRGGLDHGEAEAVVGAAVAHRGAADLQPCEIALDLAGEQRAAGA